MTFPFPIVSRGEKGLLQVSKWLKHQVLLDEQEMASLINVLTPFYIAVVSEPVNPTNALVTPDEFLEKYTSYVQTLKQGIVPDERALKRYFSSVFTTSLDTLYALDVGHGKYLIKPDQPVIQVQGHHFFYSALDEKFHPMALSQESITWGIQFAYPQLFQNPNTHQIGKVGPECVNTKVFQALCHWLRNHTIPTPFVIEGIRRNAPIRIGKQCLKWIDSHPQLKEKAIAIFPIAT